MSELEPVAKPPRMIVVSTAASITAAAVVAIAVMMFIDRQPQLQPQAQWQYDIVAPKDEQLLIDLSAAGREGWQIASCRRAVVGQGESSAGAYECIMQRVAR